MRIGHKVLFKGIDRQSNVECSLTVDVWYELIGFYPSGTDSIGYTILNDNNEKTDIHSSWFYTEAEILRRDSLVKNIL